MGFEAGTTFTIILLGGLLAACCNGSAAGSLTVVRELQSSQVFRELNYPFRTRRDFPPPYIRDNYENNLSVAIKISAPLGNRVTLTFSRFEFDEFGQDYVQLLNSLRPEEVDSAERMTGSKVPEDLFTSAGSTLYIGITTDETFTYGGFSALYKTVEPEFALPGIVEELDSTSSVQQFHYPPQAGAHSSITYSVVKVSAPLGKRVRLTLSRASPGATDASYVQLLDNLSIRLIETQPKLRDVSEEVFHSKSNAAYVLHNSDSAIAPTDAYNMSYLAVGCVPGDCNFTEVCEESWQEPGYTCTCSAHAFIDANGFCVHGDGTLAAIHDQTAVLERMERNQEQLINLTASSIGRKEDLLRKLLRIVDKIGRNIF